MSWLQHDVPSPHLYWRVCIRACWPQSEDGCLGLACTLREEQAWAGRSVPFTGQWLFQMPGWAGESVRDGGMGGFSQPPSCLTFTFLPSSTHTHRDLHFFFKKCWWRLVVKYFPDSLNKKVDTEDWIRLLLFLVVSFIHYYPVPACFSVEV